MVIKIKYSSLFPHSRRGLVLLGQTRRRNKYIPLEMRLKRAWGKRNEWSLRNGNEYFPKPWGAEVGVFRRLQAHG